MNRRESRHCHAFTLIELLVVIAIIGIIAAMVVNMNSAAQTAKRNAQVNGDKANLTLMIDNYHAKLNFYPPDNGSLASALPANYEALAAINPLLYELTGASINPATGNIVCLMALIFLPKTSAIGTGVPPSTMQTRKNLIIFSTQGRSPRNIQTMMSCLL